MRKKVLSIIISVIMVCMPLIIMNASAAGVSKLYAKIDTGEIVAITDTDGDGFYEIGTADELYAFATIVNSGLDSVNAILTNDIVINSYKINENSKYAREWTPIAKVPANNSNFGEFEEDYVEILYSGTFDGNNKTISGLYYSDDSKEYVAMFVSLSQTGVIKNLNIENSFFNGYCYTATLVGMNKGGTISNCTNYGTAKAFQLVGGLVGRNYGNGTINDCINYGDVDAVAMAGGITCENYGTITNSVNKGHVTGGLTVAGIAEDSVGKIYNCVNEGTIEVTTDYNAYYQNANPRNICTIGGIAAKSYKSKIDCCCNKGNLVSPSPGNDYAAGIVGISSQDKITNCINSGNITGTSFVGYITVIVENSTLENCCNVVASSYVDLVSHLAGRITSTNIKNCYYIYDANKHSKYLGSVSGVEAKTAEEFASGEVAYLLQGEQKDNIWGQTIGVDKFPSLGGEAVYKSVDSEENITYTNTNQ